MAKSRVIRIGDSLPIVKDPSVPREVRTFTDRVRDVLTATGDGAIVRNEDLKKIGLVDSQMKPVPQAQEDDYLPPPAVITGFAAVGAFQNIILTWDQPNYPGHSLTEVWGSPIYDTSIPPSDPNYVDPTTYDDLSQAVVVGVTAGPSFNDNIGGSRGRYYWVRNVNERNIAGPYNAVNGTNAETAVDVDYLLGALTGAITQSELAQSLSTEIDRIDTNAVAIQQETQVRETQTGELYAQYTVKIDNNGYVSGFGLASTPVDGGGVESEFAVLANRFYVAAPGLTFEQAPFIIQATATTINGVAVPAGVYMADAFIRNGSIVNAKIANAAIDNAKIANLDASKITTGFLNADRIQAGSIDAKIATFSGALSAATGTFAGSLSAATGTFAGTVSAGRFLTAASPNSRIDIQDDGVYLLWAGSGTKNDTNATFYVKKNGEGRISGEWLEGELIMKTSATGTTSATATGHASNGKPIDVTFNANYRGFVTGNYEGVAVFLTVAVKRGTTTLQEFEFSGVGGVYEPELNQTRVVVGGSGSLIDQPGVGTFSYSVTMTEYMGGTTTYTSISTNENLVG